MRLFRARGILLSALYFLPCISNAQKLDTVSNFSITGYVDAYYAYYNDSVGAGNFQKFPSTSPRSNNPSLNVAQLAVQYNADKVRGTAVFHYGDIPAATWAPAPYRVIQEAHVGFKVYSKLWIDAGFFRTHFGTELLLPVENITSSVAIGTFFEPYYESGVRLNFDPTPKLEINLYLLSGYNVFVDNNEKKSFGMAVTYALWENGNIAYTNYIGDETPDGIQPRHLRFHNNLYLNYQRKKIKLQVGGDYCMQQNSDLATGTKSASMYSALATVRDQLTGKFAIYVRGEYLSDPDGWMTGTIKDYTGKLTGLKLWGHTGGFEYKPTEESYVRLEGRTLYLDKDQYIFYNDGSPRNSRTEIILNAGVTFELLKSIKTRLIPPADQKAAGD